MFFFDRHNVNYFNDLFIKRYVKKIPNSPFTTTVKKKYRRLTKIEISGDEYCRKIKIKADSLKPILAGVKGIKEINTQIGYSDKTENKFISTFSIMNKSQT